MPLLRRLAASASALALSALLAACFVTEESGTTGDSTGEADSVVTNVTWSSNAVQFRNDTNLRVAYVCPDSGSIGIVWGTDTYTDDSSVCTAAVHAGKITLAQGGRVVIKMVPGQSAYTGSARHGITTLSYGVWLFSYVFL